MLNRWYRKGLVIGIIILFIGTSITPIKGGFKENIDNELSELVDNKDAYQINTRMTGSIENNDIYWWPMFQHDQNHSGYSPSSAPETNKMKWMFSSSDPGSSSSIYNNKVYAGCSDFFCLDADDGSLLWKNTWVKAYGGQVVVNDRVYISGIHFYCLDANDGTLIWFTKVSDYWGSNSRPVISNGKFYAGNDNGNIYCLKAEDGSVIWSYSTAGPVRSSPAICDSKLYVGSHDDKIYCLDADDGSVIWTYTTGGDVISSPAVSNSKVYVGSNDGYMYCLNVEDGNKIWSFKTIGRIWPSPAIAYGNVYFSADDDYVYCLDADDGSIVWSYQTTAGNYHSLAVADYKVYAPTSYEEMSYLYYIECFDVFTGEKIWRFKTNGEAWAPAIADRKLYVSTVNGKLYCFGEDEPNLHCSGSLNWLKVKKGSLVTGNFTVENVGESGTKLDWEISEWPTWGDWSFSPSYGLDLLPEDGPVIVEVEVVAPDSNKLFSGVVKVCNTEDPYDYHEIDVSLSTKTKKCAPVADYFYSFKQLGTWFVAYLGELWEWNLFDLHYI
jgi:outer membrane protein assembly factor BamB